MSSELTIAVEDAVRRVLDTHKRSPWLDSDAAAEYLGCTPGTLKTWRSRGEGPRYNIIQSKLVRYHVDELDAFVRGDPDDFTSEIGNDCRADLRAHGYRPEMIPVRFYGPLELRWVRHEHWPEDDQWPE